MIKDKGNLFEEITQHLLLDPKPSIYLSCLFEENKQIDYPFTMLARLKTTKQSKKYHPEGNVFNHTMLVVDEAAKVRNKSKDSKVFMWAALLHDIGKPDTTRIKKDKITAYNHDNIGATLAKEFLESLIEDKLFIQSVVELVKWHMHILYVVNDLSFGDVSSLVRECDTDEIALLGWCDRMGRTNANASEEEENIKIFISKCRKIKENITRI